jgi:hypothetical protein
LLVPVSDVVIGDRVGQAEGQEIGFGAPAYLPACCRMVWTCPPIVIVPSRSTPVFCATE